MSADKCWRMCHYTIFDCSVIRFVLLMMIQRIYQYCWKWPNQLAMNSLHDNCAISRPLFLVCRKPEVKYAWLVHLWVWENPRFPLGWINPILKQWFSILQENEIFNKSNHNHEESTASREDDQSNSLGNGLGNNLNEYEHTMQLELTAMQNLVENVYEYQVHTVDWDEF